MAIRDLMVAESRVAESLGGSRMRPGLQVALAALFGLLLGLAALTLSPVVVISLLLVLFYNVLLFYRAEVGILSILVITSTIVFENVLPLVRLGFGSFHISDLLLIALLGQIALKRLLIPSFRLVLTPIDPYLIAFFFVMIFSTALAIFEGLVTPTLAFRELRVFSYYLVFFAVTNLVRTKSQWLLFVRGLFFLGSAVALALVVQAISGQALKFIPGYVSTLVTQGTAYSGVIRAKPPGVSLALLGFIASGVLLIIARGPRSSGLFKLFLCALLGAGLVLTFTRAYITLALAALVLLVFILKGPDRQRLVRVGLAAALALGLLVYFSSLQPESRFGRIVLASVERAGSLGDEGSRSLSASQSTLLWRNSEYEYSLPQIASRPIIGIGIGSQYRPWDSRLDWVAYDGSGKGFDGRAYTHNGHVWIILKTGFLGYICFVGMSLMFLVRGFRKWRALGNPTSRAVVLGFTLTYVAVVVGSVVHSMFAEWFWVPVLGSIFGLNEVAYRLEPKEVRVPKAPCL